MCSLVAEELHSIGRSELAYSTLEHFTGVMISFIMFACLPSEFTDEVTLGASVVRLVINHHLFHTLIL